MTKREDSIITPHEHDVLSGRGNFVNYHSGNEHFRALVRKHKVAYVACPKPQKGKFSKLIYDEIRARDPPGRFLKQDQKTKLWYDIGEKKALDKTRQALREGAPEIQKELNGDEDYDDDCVSFNDSPGVESPIEQQGYSFPNASAFPGEIAPPFGMRGVVSQRDGGALPFDGYPVNNTNVSMNNLSIGMTNTTAQMMQQHMIQQGNNAVNNGMLGMHGLVGLDASPTLDHTRQQIRSQSALLHPGMPTGQEQQMHHAGINVIQEQQMIHQSSGMPTVQEQQIRRSSLSGLNVAQQQMRQIQQLQLQQQPQNFHEQHQQIQQQQIQQQQIQQRQHLLQLQQQFQQQQSQQQQFQQQQNQQHFQSQQGKQQQFQQQQSQQQQSIAPQRAQSSMLPALSSPSNMPGARDNFTVARSYSDSLALQADLRNKYSEINVEDNLNIASNRNSHILNPSQHVANQSPSSKIPDPSIVNSAMPCQIEVTSYNIQDHLEPRPLLDPYNFGKGGEILDPPVSPSYQETEQLGPLPSRRKIPRERSGRKVYVERQGSNNSLVVDNVFGGEKFELVTSRSGRFNLSQHMSGMSLSVDEIHQDDDDTKQLGSLLNSSMRLTKKHSHRYPVKQISSNDMGGSLSENTSAHGGSIIVGCFDMSVATLGDASLAPMMTDSQGEMSFGNVFDDTDKDASVTSSAHP